MAAAAVVPVENLSFVPLPDGLLKGSFSVNVPDDGDCFYHAILTYLKVTKPNHKFGNEQVTNMNIGSFKEYLLNLALTIRDTPGEVIESLTQKGCWAGEATTVWFVSNVGMNIDIYNISSDDININRFEIPGNEDTVKLVFTGNHYMAYRLLFTSRRDQKAGCKLGRCVTGTSLYHAQNHYRRQWSD